ncbi:MAG: hypothetical protein E6G82_04115 [Alphaproteobacteria bacterium]|nr:MAG: hypothetical protein E6G82_04115 [Alphaproteobacteria bacterium]
MAWGRSTTDPTTDAVAPEVVAAFEKAQKAGLDTKECYMAAVEAWRRAHPDQTLAYASQQAVEVILRSKVRLRIVA